MPKGNASKVEGKAHPPRKSKTFVIQAGQEVNLSTCFALTQSISIIPWSVILPQHNTGTVCPILSNRIEHFFKTIILPPPSPSPSL